MSMVIFLPPILHRMIYISSVVVQILQDSQRMSVKLPTTGGTSIPA
jgi:hypothetical protein